MYSQNLKNMFRKLLILLLVLGSFNYSFANSAYDTFEYANEMYEQKKYDSARQNYLRILNEGMISKELLLNLGNSYFKLDSIPSAILYYEKGLKIAPGDEDLMHNLHYCNTILKDKNTIKKSILLNDFVYSFLGKSPNYWAYASIVLLLFCCILFFLFRIISNGTWQRVFFYSSILVFLLFITTIVLSSISKSRVNNTKYGIMFPPVTKVLVEPSESASTSYQLHEGSKAKITGENENWYEISFNEKKGWIKKKTLKII